MALHNRKSNKQNDKGQTVLQFVETPFDENEMQKEKIIPPFCFD